MIRPWQSVLVVASVALLLAGGSASAQTIKSLFFDDFESYNIGSLEKEDPNGTNQAPNGSGNPWFGPLQYAPNCTVVGPENGVMPHSGQQMIRGQGPSDIDQNWYNLAYRLNNDASGANGMPFQENIALDWWFYDPIDPNDPNSPPATDYRDYIALAFYDTAPADRDGPDGRDPPSIDYNLNRLVSSIQRISLGAGPQTGSVGFDPSVYQARVVGADDGLANGWFNTSAPRSVGWHHAMIVVGPLLGDGTNDLTFFIDNLTTPTLEHTVPAATNFGYNVIEINGAFGPAPGYYDDVNFSVVTP